MCDRAFVITPPGIFCLEGQWGDLLTDKTSTRHLLDCLQSARIASTIYFDVHTTEELFHLLDKWTQKRYSAYPVCWLAFHGYEGGIWIGNSKCVDLADLSHRYPGRFAGRVIYFGSCSTMQTDRDDLRSFCKITGARAVCGYTRDVDWLEAAAFELLLLYELGYSKRLDHMKRRLGTQYGDLTARLSFDLIRPNEK